MMERQFSVQLLLDNLPGMVYRCKMDSNWTMEYVSPWVKELTGYSANELLNNQSHSYAELIKAEDRDYVAREVQKAIASRKPFQISYRIIDSLGHLRWVWEQGQAIYDENNEVVAIEGFITDITHQKQIEARLERLATHDALTGLPNRAFLNEHLQKLLDATRSSEPVAVMFLDLDRFKNVNDVMGHGPGDILLHEVALRVQSIMRPEDILARLGGDEFIVAARCAQDRESAAAIAENILDALRTPFVIEGQEIFVSVSIGISMAPRDGKTKDVLFKNADIAMYRAKEAGRNGYRFFHREMSEAAKIRGSLNNALRHALERNEFTLHYQPRVNLSTMQITGMEALIRWNHPELGQVAPLQFIPIAEECSMIEPLGKWALNEACRQTRSLIERLNHPLCISVNLSAWQLKSPTLIEQVHSILEETGLPGRLLELELTESTLIEDVDASAAMLKQLKGLGVRLAVDDFGTGYSSLAYLQRFPLDVLKLDRTFVGENAERGKNLHFIKAFLDLARALNLSVVAEGIETREALNVLRSLSCDEGQGYLFAKPLPYHALEAMLTSSLHIRL